MNIRQAFKMAGKSIWGKKGRSALTMLGVVIGIAAVMTIVSVMNGYTDKMMEQYNAMGTNRLNVQIWNYMYEEDENGNWVAVGKNYFPDLYNYCTGLTEYIAGVTPEARANATVVYGTKSSDNFSWDYDNMGNLIGDRPPSVYYVSDQYSACNNLTIAKGRDLALLDVDNVSQVCVLGAQAADIFFGTVEPVGKQIQLNGQSFLVVGIYAPRITGESASSSQIDNIIVLPYTTRRVLGGEAPESFTVKVRSGQDTAEVKMMIQGFLQGLVDQNTAGFYVDSDDQWQQMMQNSMGMVSIVLGGIAAISLLVGGIGIMNIMLVTVTERTREIGIRRAIGAQRSSIVAQFLIEAAMLCGIGGIIGIGLGTVGSLVAGRLMFQMTIYPAVWITASAFSLSVALGIVFGIYPAAKASKLQPVEALRAE